MNRISLKCQCGAVQGSVSHVSPKVGNHVVCYCKDCQTYGNHLANGEGILDEWGGTEIYQTPPWHVTIDKGMKEIQRYGMPKTTTFRVIWRLFKWKFTGGNKPNPFFDQSGHSICEPRILSGNPE